MTYNPKMDKAECLGLPYPKEEIIDVVADEKRGLTYIVTSEEQHFVIYGAKEKTFREPDPSLRLRPYATTLIDKRGRAHVISKEFQLVGYNPETDKLTRRDLFLGDEQWLLGKSPPVPT